MSSGEDTDGRFDTPIKEVDKEELTKKHKNWEVELAGLRNGTKTIDTIKKKYKLSTANEKLIVLEIKIDLNPDYRKWDEVKQKLSDKKVTITEIKKHFRISAKNEKLLKAK